MCAYLRSQPDLSKILEKEKSSEKDEEDQTEYSDEPNVDSESEVGKRTRSECVHSCGGFAKSIVLAS